MKFLITLSLLMLFSGNPMIIENRHFLAIGEGSVWVWNADQQVVEQVNLRTGYFTTVTTIPFTPRTGSVEAGFLWILSDMRDQVAQIDLTTHELIATIATSAYFETWEFVTLVTGEGTVWLKGEQTVLELDPQTHQVIGEPIPAGEEVLIAVVANGELWTGSHDDGLISRIDLETHEITAQFDLGFSVHGLAVSHNAAWVLDEHGFAIVQVDLETNTEVARIPIDFVGSNIAVANDDLWVAPAARDSGRPTNNDEFVRIDVQTAEIVESIHVGVIQSLRDGYYLTVVEDNQAWVVIYDDAITTLRQL